MAKLVWSVPGEHVYEIGVDRGVLYVEGENGVVWNGLVSVEENPTGGEVKAYYLDGVKYLQRSTREEFEATINAFYSPALFDSCDGLYNPRPGLFVSQQRRKSFGLSYRTRVGTDMDENSGYKIHLIYNALAEPTQRSHETIGEKTEAPLLSWNLKTKDVLVPEVGYSSHLVVDTRTATPYSIQLLENILYGDDSEFARLPTAEELMLLFEDSQPLTVTDLGSGKFSIVGSGLVVHMLDESHCQIESDNVIFLDDDTVQISSE